MIIGSLSKFVNYSKRLAEILNLDITLFSEKVYPDGEVLVRALEPDKLKEEEEIILYFRLYPQQNIELFKLFLTLDIIRDYSSNIVINLLLPYLPYARQDKRFLEGEVISLKSLIKIFESFCAKRLIVVDCHNPKSVIKYAKLKFVNIQAADFLVKYVTERILKGMKPILVSPDVGGVERVKKAAKKINADFTYLHKVRDRYTGKISSSISQEFQIRNKPVLVLDDLISTGNTLVEAATIFNKLRASTFVAAATHLLLLDEAEKRIFDVGYKNLVGTNSIDTPYSKVKIEVLIANSLKKYGLIN